MKTTLREKQRRSFRKNLEVWEKNRQYYHAHKAEIIRKYRGKYVAIWNGAVIDSDKDQHALTDRVYSTLGYKPAFFTRATEKMRVMRIPSYVDLGPPLPTL